MGGLEDNDPEAEETSESASISSPRAWKDRVVLLSASAARMYSSRSSSPWMRPDVEPSTVDQELYRRETKARRGDGDAGE